MDEGVLARREARLAELVAIQAEQARLHAREQELLVALACDGDADGRSKRWVREEIAAALGIAPTTAGSRIDLAFDLLQRLPLIHDRLVEGRLTFVHARIVAEATAPVDDLTAVRVQNGALRVLDKAGGLLPAGRFRAEVARLVQAEDPRTAQQQHDAEYDQRRVWLRPEPAGMAGLGAYLRADHALAADRYIADLARTLPDDGRTADQKRADVLVDLLTGRDRVARRVRGPQIRVTVAASTLLGVDASPAELAGYGPIPAELARTLAADPTGTWRRILTDDEGQLLELGTKRYRPPPRLSEHVRARYTRCTFPGCGAQAEHADLDHVVAWPTGPTSPENLHPLCSRHHHLKHETAWEVATTDHGMRWISPTGRRYLTVPTEYPRDATLNGPPGIDDGSRHVLLTNADLDYFVLTGQIELPEPVEPEPPPF